MSAVRIDQATTNDDHEAARSLFKEYAGGLGISLAFQDFDGELATLPGKYAPPDGRLLIGRTAGKPAGCIALRHLDEGVCEMKRLYVRPSARGTGLGRALIVRLLAEAVAGRYRRMVLDTLSGVMDAAISIYRSLAFTEIAPYCFNPHPNALFLGRELPDVRFRRLNAEDLPLLHRWLNEPHMREFYQPAAIALQAVVDKYLPRTSPTSPVRSDVVLVDQMPIGKIQCYRNADFPSYGAAIGATGGFSIDLFIGEPRAMGKGIGAAMLRSYVGQVAFPRFPDERRCYIAHAERNVKAMRCSVAAGFRPEAKVLDDGVPSLLLRIDRGEVPWIES